jgi:hypothetical protein
MDKLSRERTLELLAAEPMDKKGRGACWNIQAACNLDEKETGDVCATCYYGGIHREAVTCGFEDEMTREDASMKSLTNIHEYAVKLYKRIKIMEIINEKE